MPKYVDDSGLSRFWDNIKGRPVRAFATVAEMQAATDLEAGMTCHTNGFHSEGDGGAAYYAVVEVGTANGMDVLALQDSLLATLVVTEPYVTPEMYGAYGDGTHNDTAAIQGAVTSKRSIVFANAYVCGSVSASDVDGASYVGKKGMTITGETALTFSDCSNLLFDSLTFKSCTHSNFAIRFTDCDTVAVKGCKFEDMQYSAIQLIRSAISATSRRYLFDGCTFVDVDTSETWGGGIFWAALGSDGTDTLEAKQISDVTVTNCFFENVGCAGVNSGGCIGLSVCNNICDQNNTSYTGTMGLLTTSRESAKIVASDNIVLHTKFEGMIFNRSYDVVANGNYFEDCKQAIAVENTAQNCTFVGNSIVGGYADGLLNKDNTNSLGIFTSNVTKIRIDGNTIRDCFNGIYINRGTQDIDMSDNEINTASPCITGITSTTELQTKNVRIRNNRLVATNVSSGAVTFVMHSGTFVIDGNTIVSSGAAAMLLKRPFDTSDFTFVVTRNKCESTGCAMDISDTSSNQTDGTIHYLVTDNDFSGCASAYKKDANARVLAMRYARNNLALTDVELFGHFDGNSVLKYAGTLAALLASTPGSQNMSYVRWQVGCVVECTDTFIHVTRAGNPSTGATLQYKEW